MFKMSSFDALSWGSLKMSPPLTVQKDSFDSVFISFNVDSTRKTFQILDTVFQHFLRISYIQVQFTIIKIFLRVSCTVTELLRL